MNTAEIKIKLHDEIENSDERLLKMIYAIIKEYHSDEDDIDAKRMSLVMEERTRYLKGEGKSHSWEEVKEMARNKEKRNEV